jgi:hypothetical protein
VVAAAKMHEEEIVSLVASGPATAVRSTLIVVSVAALRNEGLFDAYVERLAPDARASVLEAIAGTWMPMEIAMAHYAACDALGLSPRQEHDIGMKVGERLHSTLLSTVVRLASSSGVTPWMLIRNGQRIYDRIFTGGGVRILKLGPKDVRIELHGAQVMRSHYFRNAFRGQIEAAFGLLGFKAYARDARVMEPNAEAVQVAWA